MFCKSTGYISVNSSGCVAAFNRTISMSGLFSSISHSNAVLSVPLLLFLHRMSEAWPF